MKSVPRLSYPQIRPAHLIRLRHAPTTVHDRRWAGANNNFRPIAFSLLKPEQLIFFHSRDRIKSDLSQINSCYGRLITLTLRSTYAEWQFFIIRTNCGSPAAINPARFVCCTPGIGLKISTMNVRPRSVQLISCNLSDRPLDGVACLSKQRRRRPAC